MLNNVSIKELVEFRRISERRQSTFASKLKVPKTTKNDDSEGGNYWTRSTGGVSTSFKLNDNAIVKERIELLLDAYKSVTRQQTKTMYERNLEILHNYIDFDFSIWRPQGNIKFLTKPDQILPIKNLPLKVAPQHVFSFGTKEEPKVGGIWFVIWLKGFKPSDLGMFCEAQFKFLSDVYSTQYKVDPNYCLTVDAASQEAVRYQQILDGNIPSFLEPTIDMLNKYLH